MPKIYLCPEGPGRVCTIVSKEKADILIRQDPDWDVYVLDVEKYVPTPPSPKRETGWIVKSGDRPYGVFGFNSRPVVFLWGEGTARELASVLPGTSGAPIAIEVYRDTLEPVDAE